MPGGYDTATTPNSAVTVGASSVALVAARNGRFRAVFCNDHASQIVYLSLGGTAVVNQGIRIGPGQVYTLENYDGPVNAIASGATTVVTYVEY